MKYFLIIFVIFYSLFHSTDAGAPTVYGPISRSASFNINGDNLLKIGEEVILNIYYKLVYTPLYRYPSDYNPYKSGPLNCFDDKTIRKVPVTILYQNREGELKTLTKDIPVKNVVDGSMNSCPIHISDNNLTIVIPDQLKVGPSTITISLVWINDSPWSYSDGPNKITVYTYEPDSVTTHSISTALTTGPPVSTGIISTGIYIPPDLPVNEQPGGIFINEEYKLAVVSGTTSPNFFTIYDISKTNPVQISTTYLHNVTNFRKCVVHPKGGTLMLYLAVDEFLMIYRISDPNMLLNTLPISEKNITFSGNILSFELLGNTLFIIVENQGIFLYDVSSDPVLISSFTTIEDKDAFDIIKKENEMMYVSTNNKLLIFNITTTELNGRIVSSLTPFSSIDITSDNSITSGVTTNGIEVTTPSQTTEGTTQSQPTEGTTQLQPNEVTTQSQPTEVMTQSQSNKIVHNRDSSNIGTWLSIYGDILVTSSVHQQSIQIFDLSTNTLMSSFSFSSSTNLLFKNIELKSYYNNILLFVNIGNKIETYNLNDITSPKLIKTFYTIESSVNQNSFSVYNNKIYRTFKSGMEATYFTNKDLNIADISTGRTTGITTGRITTGVTTELTTGSTTGSTTNSVTTGFTTGITTGAITTNEIEITTQSQSTEAKIVRIGSNKSGVIAASILIPLAVIVLIAGIIAFLVFRKRKIKGKYFFEMK